MRAPLVLVEVVDGSVDRLSAEAIAFARSIGGESSVEAVVVGVRGVGASVAAALGSLGVVRIHAVEDPRLEVYSAAAVATGLGVVVASGAFDALIGPGSERGIEVLAHVGARSGAAVAVNVIAVDPGAADGRWMVTRQRWAGSLLEEAWLDGTPKLLTVAAHAVAAAEAVPGASPAEVISVAAQVSDADLVARVVGVERTGGDRVSLAEAKVVVGGGRGLGSAESFAMLDELADLLGAAVGVSRVATSLGWRPHSQQVGQTGTRIAPDLYIACGISGAIQHIVGCKSAKRILAINTDRDAPIFLKATYGIVGDVHVVVPAITAEVRRAKGL